MLRLVAAVKMTSNQTHHTTEKIEALKQLIAPIALLIFKSLSAQMGSGLMQQPDISHSHITFIYDNDVWIASKSGDQANRISTASGTESFPRFSPDGTKIAFTANYQGNKDVYVINISGGVPKRLTYHGMDDNVLGWTRDGKAVLFSSKRESGRQRYNQFYTISIDGGTASKLSVPYGEFASFSPSGKKIAYTDRTRVDKHWKRYRGGTAANITLFDLNSLETESISRNSSNNELPMWIENSIYYMSDNGPNKRNNLWKYDIASDTSTQLTFHKDYDITFAENGPDDIIYEVGGKLNLFNLETNSISELSLNLISDQKSRISKKEKISKFFQSASISPDGSNVVVQARGDLFTLPSKKGFTSNITISSGVADRKPSWSPDGKSIAYWSDVKGEYQLTLFDTKSKKSTTVTNFQAGFYYNIYWSPDSKKIAFIDQAMNICFIDLATKKVSQIDKAKYMFEIPRRNFRVSWSPDSRWLAYSRGIDYPYKKAIFLYDTKNRNLSRLTSGYYSDDSPTFSVDGKYLFFTTSRKFKPIYSDLDNTFIYPNTTHIAVGTLNANEKSLLSIADDDQNSPETRQNVGSSDIHIAGFENRVELLNIDPGNLRRLAAVKNKLVFTRLPNSGASKLTSASIHYFDLKEKKVKTILIDAQNYVASANGERLLVTKGNKIAVIDIREDQKFNSNISLDKVMLDVNPVEEWRQIFNDVWRFYRDFFYDPNMHGVDWDMMKERYGKLIDQANSRIDVNIIIGDLIAELDASHADVGGGDLNKADDLNVGYLGADIVPENGHFRIKKIVRGASWDVEERSPLDGPGMTVEEGDYILSINGNSLDTQKPIFAALQGLAGETIELTISGNPSSSDAKKILVKTMSSEKRLRHLAWVENNRRRVEKETNGKIGYIYVRSTGTFGQSELIRQFYGQINKEGLIIDERFNSGGQIPDRFIELLERDPLAYFSTRDGANRQWPPAANFGPKVMLINGFSESGGDAFPFYFKQKGLGPLIGTRTWGGLIGLSGAPNLIDNGRIEIPTFRMYDLNGEWFREGHGVDPDIRIAEDFQQLASGIDVQLEAAIKEVMRLLDLQEFHKPSRPEYENRNK